MKKIIVPIILVIFFIVLAVISLAPKNDKKKISNNIVQNTEISNNAITENKVDESMNTVYIKVNSSVLNIELEDNSATIELKERLKNGEIVVNAHDYGGFEKVGDLGFLLPREDTSITTSAGDIVLYQGNQISLFYGSHSWSYTKLGKIENIESENLKEVLGSGNVTLVFTLK